MLLPTTGVRVNSAMDDMNLIQQAQRHHLVVREIGEEIDLEIGPGEYDPSFGNTTLLSAPLWESSAEEHGESKQLAVVSQLSNGVQDMSQTQQVKRKKKVVKRWREEWADTYKWAYVDVKDGTLRIFCSVCREFGRKHRRNPYGNEGSRNMHMSALEEHNNSLLHKEALRLQSASKDKIMADKPVYVKDMENKENPSEDRNSNITKVKPSFKANPSDSEKPSSVFVSSGFPSNFENTNKKNVDNHFEDSTKSRSRVMQTHSQHLKADNVDVTEMSTKYKNSESRVSHDIDLDGRSESNRRVSANGSKQDTKQGMISYPVKESKRQTPNSCEEVADGRKDSVFADRNNNDQKKRESSSDENSCSYSKFEKEEPEFKAPITTFSQYKEYVQEFNDKYESYVSLNKILEDYKDEFQKLSDDLDYAKRMGNMDRCESIKAQIMESYRRCGSRHKRLKKIFIVLYEELAHTKQMIANFVASYRD